MDCSHVPGSDSRRGSRGQGAGLEGLSPVAVEILRYVAAHPQAQDTLEGIVDWWLVEHRIQTESLRVRSALDSLVDAGLLSRFRGADRRTHYAVRSGSTPEIERLLEEAGREE